MSEKQILKPRTPEEIRALNDMSLRHHLPPLLAEPGAPVPVGKIYSAILKVMAEVGPIAKNKENKQQGYKFRGIDDAYEALQLIMANAGVLSVPYVEEVSRKTGNYKSGGAYEHVILTIRYTFYADDGSFVVARVVGEGMDSGDKASNKAMSVADKYSLLQVFKIPTAEAKDPENDDHNRNNAPEAGGNDSSFDSFDQSQGQPTETTKKQPDAGKKVTGPTKSQMNRLFMIAQKANWSEAHQKDYCAKYGIKSRTILTPQQYQVFCNFMQDNPKDNPKA